MITISTYTVLFLLVIMFLSYPIPIRLIDLIPHKRSPPPKYSKVHSHVSFILAAFLPLRKSDAVCLRLRCLRCSRGSCRCCILPIRPQKKKEPTSSCSKSAPRPLHTKDFFMDASRLEALKAKIIELNGKETTVEDLSRQVEEMKTIVNNLMEENENVVADKIKMEMKVEEMRKENARIVEEHAKKSEQEKKNMQRTMEEISWMVKDLKKVLDETQRETTNECGVLETRITECSQFVVELNRMISVKEEELCEAVANLEKVKNDHLVEIEELKKIHNKELEEVRCELLKLVRELEKAAESLSNFEDAKKQEINEINGGMEAEKLKFIKKIEELQILHNTELEEIQYELLKAVSEKDEALESLNNLDKSKKQELEELYTKMEADKIQLIEDNEKQLQQLKEDMEEAKVLAKLQLLQDFEEIESNLKLKLLQQEKESQQILKECQAISEYNIIQCEVEKNQIKKELSEKIKMLQEYQHSNELLYFKYEAAEEERKNLLEQLHQNKIYTEDQKQIDLNTIRNYEIAIKQFKDTIEALKKRLLESDSDVMQLKKELEESEEERLNYEASNSRLIDEVVTLRRYIEEEDLQDESFLKQTLEVINQLKVEFDEKLEGFCRSALGINSQLFGELQGKTMEVDGLKELCEGQNKLNGEANELLSNAAAKITEMHEEYTSQEEQLKECLAKVDYLQEENKKLEESNKSLNHQLIQQETEILQVREETEINKDEMDLIYKQLHALHEKSDSYYQYCEYYKKKSEEQETDIEELCEIRKKYIEQSGKYDALIQRCENLERKNLELELQLKKSREELEEVNLKKALQNNSFNGLDTIENENGKLKKSLNFYQSKREFDWKSKGSNKMKSESKGSKKENKENLDDFLAESDSANNTFGILRERN